MDDFIGQQIRGYEIREIIAHGGYGAVYKAFQPSVGREVAIKIILPQHAAKPEFKLRFESEAQLVAQLEHPHVMPLYDFWQNDQGAFLVMRLVKGGSLRQQLRQETVISLKNIVRIYDQIGSGLAIAHEAKVVHRDIKPDNILLDQYGNAYLSDFGIAKNLQLDAHITATPDEIVGTPGYISPEQIRSLPITIQTDIYALGIMLYELLTGKAPFNKPGMQILLSHLNDAVPSVLTSNPTLPPALDQVIARASAKDPIGRYPNVMQMVEALNDIFAPVATPILPREIQPRTVDPNRHVFVSYTQTDSEFVQRLVYDLKSEGIPVWVDKRGLKAGTRNWENAVREAIQSAYAVILIASPDARQSSYIFDELAIAEMYKCPIYPVWVAGENWSDSISTGLENSPYIDARGDHYADVLRALVTTLGTGVGKAAVSDDLTETIQVSGNFTPRNPYKGLRAFRQADQGDFFGRDSLIKELISAFSAYMQPGLSRVLPVIGPSGSGKSSVVMAGMLPALQKGALPQSREWTYLTPFVPGEQPLENMMLALAEALPNKSQSSIMADLTDPAARALHTLSRQMVGQRGSRVVMYIDQFEELFTQSVREEERQQFINLILTAAAEPGGPLAVVLTLRADFYDRPMHYPELGKVIETNSKLVLPMSLADLFEVVQKPASLPDVRLTFDKGLVAELVFEVRDQAGGLPLLQFTLDQLFDRREGSQLTNEAYQAIGGVQGALAKHTEAAYANLPTDDHRRLARGLFMRLIEPGATEQDTTRRRAPRSEFVLADAQQNRLMDQVISAFVAARLLLADQTKGVTTIEVSHEALIREWPRLREWLDESRADIATQQNISTDTQAWIARGRSRDDDGLYRGRLLDEALEWAARNLPSSDESMFLNTASEAQAAIQAKEAAIARRVQNSGRAAVILGIMSVIAVIAFISAILQVTTAQTQLNDANVQIGQAGLTLTPIPDTLTPVGLTLVAGQQRVQQAQDQARQAQADLGQAQQQVTAANQLVLNSGQTLTPIPLTLTPIAQTLIAGNVQLATARSQATSANDQAVSARTQVAQSGLTLTPVALTLAAGNQALAAAQLQVTSANQSADMASTQAANAGTAAANAAFKAGDAQTQVAISNATQTPIALTLTAGNDALAAALSQATQAGALVITANAQANDAGTRVAVSGLTLTPVPLTLTPVALTLAAGNQQVVQANNLFSTAAAQANQANEAANNAQMQVAQSNATQTPVALTLMAGSTQLAAAQITATNASQLVGAANALANNAQTQVAFSGLTLTPVPLTLTPIGATLVSAQTLVAGVAPTINAAGTNLADARLQVANSGLTLTPIPLTLTPIGSTLAAAQEQVAAVAPTVNAAGTNVADARAQVANAGSTLTPIGATLAAAQDQLAGVQPTIKAAGAALADAQLQVIYAGLTLTPVPLTLTPIGATLAAAQAQIAGVQPTLNQASTQIAGVQPTLDQANTQVAGVQPTVNSANTQVAGAGLTLTPLAGTLVAAESIAASNASSALSQSLAVNAQQAIGNQNYDLALVLALESLRANPSLVQSQQLLNELVYSSARFSFDNSSTSALSPDDKTLAISSGNDVTLWDNATHSQRLTLSGHTKPVTALDFSPDSASLVTASQDGTLIVWDAASGQQKLTLTGHNGAVNDVQFNPDGKTILSAGDDNTNILWNVKDGSIARKFTLGTGRPSFHIQFNNNGSRFWSWERAGSSNTVIQLFWATDRATPLWTSQVKNFSDFRSQDMTYAFAANDPNTQVTVWNATNSTEQPARTLNTTKFGVPTSRAFSLNGSTAVIAFANQGAGSTDFEQWDFNSNATTSLFTLHGLDPSEAMTFSPDGSLLAVGFGKFIVLYDMTTQRELRRLAAHSDIVTSLKFSPDGHYLLSRSLDNNTRLWDVTGSDPAEIQQIVAHTANSIIFDPGISPDSKSAYAAVNLSMFSWNTSDGKQNSRVDVLDQILGVAYSPGKPYALTVLGATSQLWDMSVQPTASRLANLGSANESNSGAAAFSADGQTVVIDGNLLALRDLQNHVLVPFDKSGIPTDSQLVSLALSPDGRYLVGAVARTYRSNQTPDPNEPAQNVIVWDTVTGKVVRTFGADLHNRRINHVAISPNSRFVLTSSNDGTLILWNIETGHLVTRLAGHTGPVNMAVFTPDGQYVISASDDTTLIQWDAQSGQLLRRFIGHSTPVKYIAMSQDGKTFISSSGDDTILVWQLTDISSTISWTLNNRYIRTLTCDEGRQYGLQNACDPETGLLLAVDATLPPNAQPGTATLSPFEIGPTATLGECFVMTARTDAGIYVGPARNRVIRFNLSPNRPVLVTGQAALPNGDIWWRVAPPGAAAGEENRYWVAKADVQESGDCDHVPTAPAS